MHPATALLLSGVTVSIFLFTCKAGTCIYYATMSLLGALRDNLSHVQALVLIRFNTRLPLWLCLVVYQYIYLLGLLTPQRAGSRNLVGRDGLSPDHPSSLRQLRSSNANAPQATAMGSQGNSS